MLDSLFGSQSFEWIKEREREGWETLAGGRSEQATFDKVELSGA